MGVVYAVWVPAVIAFWAFYGWVSVVINRTKSVWTVVWLSLLGAVPLYPIVAYLSKRVAVDTMLYDFLMVTSATLSIIFFSGAKFTVWQWAGVALCVIGLILVMRQ